MSRIDGCQQLSRILDEQVAAARQLLDLLAEEKAILTGTDIHALQDVDTRKRALLSHTEQLEQGRRQLCRGLGIGADRGAMDYLINDVAAMGYSELQSTLRTAWQRLEDLIGQCRDTNQVNGLIAQSRQRQLLHLLGLIRGGSPGNVTYQPSGAPSYAGVSSRAIVEV